MAANNTLTKDYFVRWTVLAQSRFLLPSSSSSSSPSSFRPDPQIMFGAGFAPFCFFWKISGGANCHEKAPGRRKRGVEHIRDRGGDTLVPRVSPPPTRGGGDTLMLLKRRKGGGRFFAFCCVR